MNHRDEEHQRVMDHLRRMSPEERDRLLRDAGILDEHGELTERYRPPEDLLVQQRRLTAARGDLQLHYSVLGTPSAWYVTGAAGEPIGWGTTAAGATDAALASLQELRGSAG